MGKKVVTKVIGLNMTTQSEGFYNSDAFRLDSRKAVTNERKLEKLINTWSSEENKESSLAC